MNYCTTSDIKKEKAERDTSDLGFNDFSKAWSAILVDYWRVVLLFILKIINIYKLQYSL
jgi:hypothetical protein